MLKKIRTAGKGKQVTGLHKSIPKNFYEMTREQKFEFARQLLEDMNPDKGKSK